MMTKVMVAGCGWVSIVVGLDGYTKQVVGDEAGVPGTAPHGLAALAMAVDHQGPDGARGQGVSWLRDHGGQPTAIALIRSAAPWVQQAFTSTTTLKAMLRPSGAGAYCKRHVGAHRMDLSLRAGQHIRRLD